MSIEYTSVVTWKIGGKERTFETPIIVTASGVFAKDVVRKRLDSYRHVTRWLIKDAKGNVLMSSEGEAKPAILNSENKEQEALALYNKLNNYAKVARELGIHPTTVRTWCKQARGKADGNSNNN